MRLPLAEPVHRVAVTVTFLRMEQPAAGAAPPLPVNAQVLHMPHCSVQDFRFLYDGVGGRHVWWLRRTVSDRDLAAHLAKPGVMINVLALDGRTAGFYELDRSPWPVVNISYFGLLPHALGLGLGTAFLRHAVDLAWSWTPEALTVNTCTADHPRALPSYLKVGFKPVRAVDELWEVPVRLGLPIAPHLLRD